MDNDIMNTYVMSDIHGEYDKFVLALETIDLKDEDTVFILGDILDRGTGGVKILQHIMYDARFIPILGNHEYK